MSREILWEPSAEAWDTTRIGAFARQHCPTAVGDYHALWQWSVDEPNAFWKAVWSDLDVVAHTPVSVAVEDVTMPGASWFSDTQLNYAEHMLRGNGLSDNDVAVVSESQSRAPATLTVAELREQVRQTAAGLRHLGVTKGDRVAAYLPNVPEALVAFLATASVGAIWSSCAPEFGTRAVLDRWSQIEPKVLLTIDGYRYGNKDISSSEEVAAIRGGLPSVETTVLLRYLEGAPVIPSTVDWGALLSAADEPLRFDPVPFDHPLYILYSSGTTGLPKPIVHGHGGVLLEHGKELALHFDLGSTDRFFWFSTTGWMMWNFVISGLLVGSSIVLYDGNPGYPDLNTLWSLIERTGTTWAGVSAPYLMACRDAGLHPGADFDLSALRSVGSTGAPLPSAGFRWVSDELDGCPVVSLSGGTDVCSAFVGGAPVVPVVAGAISCRQLGWKVEAFNDDGQPVVGEEGELVITQPAPSMPVSFWGDDGSRYASTYFSTYPGVWRHGDWITIETDGSCVISGRSDATLNRGGVRLGTADFYAVVEADPAVADSLVVHLEDDNGGLGELVLFVAAADGYVVDDAVRTRILAALRAELSPRHAPDEIVAMPAVPRTLSGKKLEIPVKRILQGIDPEKAASLGALANPDSITAYSDWASIRNEV